MNSQPPSNPQESTEVRVARIGLISAIAVAICGLLGTLITVLGTAISGYFSSQAVRDPVLIPIQATQTAEALGLKPALSPVVSKEAGAIQPGVVLVQNRLVLPVRIVIAGALQGEVPAQSDATFILVSSPSRLDWEVVKETTSSGRGLGDVMSGSVEHEAAGEVVEITRLAGDQEFFYPRITNHLGVECEVIVNKGWESENITSAVVPENSEGVGLGYFKLFTNSNVTLICDGKEYWWGLQPQETSSDGFYEDIDPESGLLELTLDRQD
jgi:hypothetical protein